MNAALRYALQGVLYTAFAAAVGYFSSAPAYQHLKPGEALLRLSFTHGAQLKQPCRERTAEELAKLAPNMRSPLVCSRERADVTVELEMDGKALYRIIAAPTGLAKDGASTVYRRVPVGAGRHEFRVRLSDNAQGEFNYNSQRNVEIAPGRVLLIDFNAAQGGFVFR
jgi:hypothetical protein